MEPRVVLFCDFDGTMTAEDMMVQIWREFGPPGWERTVEDMLARRMTLRRGVPELFAGISTRRARDITAFAHSKVRFRAGLQECISTCRERGTAFVVCSGALDFFLPALLEGLVGISAVHSIPTDLSGPYIRVLPPYDCPECSLCKAAVMDEYPGAFRVLVGDSVTDVHGARRADLVYARGRLPALLSEEGTPFRQFEDFHDVRRLLESEARFADRRGG